jgi:hypothetical protein
MVTLTSDRPKLQSDQIACFLRHQVPWSSAAEAYLAAPLKMNAASKALLGREYGKRIQLPLPAPLLPVRALITTPKPRRPWAAKRYTSTMIQWTSLAELQHAFANGKTTVKEVTQGYLQNIENSNGHLNAITVVNPKAVEEAERLDVSDQIRVCAMLLGDSIPAAQTR